MPHISYSLLVVCLGCVLVGAQPDLCSPEHTQVHRIIDVSQDTWVSSLEPDANFGGSDVLVVRGAGGTIQSLLKFDIAEPFVGARVVSVPDAVLLLPQATSPAMRAFVEIKTAASDWSEHNVTWNTRPALPIEAVGIFDLAAPAPINVTDQVGETFANNETAISFALLPVLSGFAQLPSREGGFPSRIAITVCAAGEVPEPQGCSVTLCQPWAQCCDDQLLGPICFDPSTHECVESSAGGRRLCGSGSAGACDDYTQDLPSSCYADTHNCLLASNNRYYMCGAGDQICIDWSLGPVCYNDELYECPLVGGRHELRPLPVDTM